jgi:glycosyltransferase involved in cell wall biosynthesis
MSYSASTPCKEPADVPLTVVVPVLNEEVLLPSFLAKTVKDLEDAKLDWELILVNDGSTDRSGEIMRTFVSQTARAKLIELSRNHGPGANLYEAYRAATKAYVCYATVDGFYDTRLLPELMTYFADHDAVSAYRTDLMAHTPGRRLQTLVNVWLVRFLFPYRFVAYHTLQIHRTDFIQGANLESKTPFICSEMLFKARALSLRIKEVGIPYLPRRGGKATGGNPNLIWKYLLDVFYFWFRWRVMRQPIVAPGLRLSGRVSEHPSP